MLLYDRPSDFCDRVGIARHDAIPLLKLLVDFVPESESSLNFLFKANMDSMVHHHAKSFEEFGGLGCGLIVESHSFDGLQLSHNSFEHFKHPYPVELSEP
jgi:hypothetical protein